VRSDKPYRPTKLGCPQVQPNQACIRTLTPSLLLQLHCRQLLIDGLLTPQSYQYGIK